MKNFLLKICYIAFGKYKQNTFPRGCIFAFDITMTLLSYVIVVFALTFPNHSTPNLYFGIIPIAIFYAISFIVFKTYRELMRFSEFNDIKKISYSILSAMLSIMLIKLLLHNVSTASIDLSNKFCPNYSIIIYHTALTFAFITCSRLLVRGLYLDFYRKRLYAPSNNTIIFGAGNGGTITYRTIAHEDCDYKIVAFADDNKNLDGKTIGGIRIYNTNFALTESFIEKHNIKTLIFAAPSIPWERKKAVVDLGLKLKLSVKSIHKLNDYINEDVDNISVSNIKDVKIEDLLGRPPICLNYNNIKEKINGKIILVTGAAGSIGSEICRQIMDYNPEKLIMVDQAESPLYDLQFEMRNSAKNKDKAQNMIFEVANIKNKQRMEGIFQKYQPQIVYHAAAYKHVPFMEDFPYEAVKANVFGTKNIADLAIQYNVGLFVMVSTDKAVRPTNVMGATKRTAEIYIQSRKSNTIFVTTRFGNVLGSNGSVIPLFKKQIKQGGPVTVTDFNITRYFMTISEACSLVLEASAIGNSSELFIFDMGSPVRIYDLAKKMIELSGAPDIQIVESGLRPGEKLTEELLLNNESLKKTSNKKIMIAEVERFDEKYVDNLFSKLSIAVDNNDEMEIVANIKAIVGEYISNNSRFCQLDKK